MTTAVESNLPQVDQWEHVRRFCANKKSFAQSLSIVEQSADLTAFFLKNQIENGLAYNISLQIGFGAKFLRYGMKLPDLFEAGEETGDSSLEKTVAYAGLLSNALSSLTGPILLLNRHLFEILDSTDCKQIEGLAIFAGGAADLVDIISDIFDCQKIEKDIQLLQAGPYEGSVIARLNERKIVELNKDMGSKLRDIAEHIVGLAATIIGSIAFLSPFVLEPLSGALGIISAAIGLYKLWVQADSLDVLERQEIDHKIELERLHCLINKQQKEIEALRAVQIALRPNFTQGVNLHLSPRDPNRSFQIEINALRVESV